MWPIRFFLDEHVDPSVVPYVRAHGIDVITAYEAGCANRRISDRDQLDFASSHGRAFVSNEKHFINAREVPQLDTGHNAGIVVIRRVARIGEQARNLRFLAETETPESIAGQTRYFESIPRGMLPDD